jgi:S-adenosylmethionine hydrolase
MKTTYGRAKPGEYLALINSFGVVEIARAEGNAAAGIGSERGAPIVVTDGIAT